VSVRAGMRDASWYANPSGHDWAPTPPKYHVVVGSGPACNPEGVLISEHSIVDAADVSVDDRCRRAGCRARWPAADTGSGR